MQHLVEHGYQVLNLDLKPLDNPQVRTLITDITDSGQVFNALSSYMGLHEFDPSLRPQPVDAVVLEARSLRHMMEERPELGYPVLKRVAEVMAHRLQATRLQLLDVYEARA